MSNMNWFRLLILGLSLLFCSSLYSQDEYGKNKIAVDFRYKVTVKETKVMDSPSKHAKALYTIKKGSLIYVDDEEIIRSEGKKWIKLSSFSSSGEYVIFNDLVKEKNTKYYNYYDSKRFIEKQKYMDEKLDGRKRTAHNILKYVVLVMFVVSLFVVVAYVTGTLSWNGIKKFFWLDTDKAPMVRFPYMTKYPYLGVLKMVGILLGSVLIVMLVIVVLYLLGYALMWFVLKLLIFLIPAIFAIALIVKKESVDPFTKNTCQKIVIFSVVLLIITICWWKSLTGWRSTAFMMGVYCMDVINVFDFVKYLAINYWKPTICIVLVPVAVFGLFGIPMLSFAGILILIENIRMRRYNIKHPCPMCGQKSEPAHYLYVNRLGKIQTLPFDLVPGSHGLFYVKPDDCNYKMPTLYGKGKDSFERRCKYCGNIINAKIGEEKHIGVVGPTNCGKTTLLYRIIGIIKRKYPNVFSYTDTYNSDTSNSETKDALVKIDEMSSKTVLNNGDYPEKTADKSDNEKTRAIQFLLDRPTMPYRIFINDISGESFDIKKERKIIEFIRNVQTILFLIDPTSTDYSDVWDDIKDNRFGKWLLNNGFGKNLSTIADFQEVMLRKIDDEIGAESRKFITINVVLVKTDLGYLNDVNTRDEKSIRKFVEYEMGQKGVIWELEKDFNVHYYAVSAADASNCSDLRYFVDKLLQNMEIIL